MSIFPKHWGMYPPEYNREIHGPYNPGMYYGKRDTPFGEVKLGELGAWLSRRKKTPGAMAAAIGRAFFRYRINWMDVKKPGPYFLYHFFAVTIPFHFWLDYNKIKKERLYRYH